MQIQRQKYGFKKSSKYIGLILFIFVWILVGSGCASTRKTTTTETTVSYPNEDANEADQERVIVEESETTTTETKAEDSGVLGATFKAIGHIISIPFKIIGGLFRIIFGG